MLEFFRNYQRYFFILITAIIIASFLFFGASSDLFRDEKREDQVVAFAVDGSPLMLSEIQALSRFIASDREDSAQCGHIPNLCNDGVIRYDLLRTGLADLLVGVYFDQIKHELEARLDRAKRFQPYVHPEVPLLKAEAVWEQFLPAMKKEWTALQAEEHASPDTFSHLSRLYLQQSYLTPEILKRILFFQHQHLGLKIDPTLQYGDLSLFGFHSLSDWFGRDFLTIASEFILNAAVVAEKKGYRVTVEEAKSDLLLRFEESLKKLQAGPSKPDISYAQHIRGLGFNEKTMVDLWRKVLLFRHYFQGVSAAAFVDRLPYKDFALYAHETATVGLYQWPPALHLAHLQDLIAFQYYLSAVAPPLEHPLDLPFSFFPLEFVEMNDPELVQVSFKAKVKEIPLSEAALQAPLKDVWEWELEEKNWHTLKTIFPTLSQGATREERLQNLEELGERVRAQVDSYSRLSLLNLHPDWKEKALRAAASYERTFSISKAGTSLPHIEKPWHLHGLLERAVSNQEEAKQELLSYSDDGKTLYQIEEIESLSPPRILTFEEAQSQGALSRIVERNLFAAYSKIRARFQSKEGIYKPFSEVKNEVAKIVFSDVFEAITGCDVDVERWTDDLYTQYRLFPVSLSAYRDLQNNPEDPRWIATEQANRMDNQFKLQRTEHSVQRTSQETWIRDNAFVMVPNEWSPLHMPPKGHLSFFYLIDKKPGENLALDQIAFGKELIAADAQRYLAEKLLQTMSQKHSIALPEEDIK